MAQDTQIKIDLSKDVRDIFFSTRVDKCTEVDCRFNDANKITGTGNSIECMLKHISIRGGGKCADFTIIEVEKK